MVEYGWFMIEAVREGVDVRNGLATDAAAQYFLVEHGQRYSAATLTKLRSTGGGPQFYRIGRFIRYLTADLDAYALSRISGPLKASREIANEMPPGIPSEGRKPACRNLANRDGQDIVDPVRSDKTVHQLRDGHVRARP